MNKVPGRVRVEGHTDDQPIRSLRYHDNFELSRERAGNVASSWSVLIDNPARLMLDGFRRFTAALYPGSEPENRSRNRRVEIVHLRGNRR